MGALHAGHAALIERARRECGCVAVTIFVNPLQFDREDDLRRYPRTLEADLDTCRRLGVDIVFAPRDDEMYPSPPACTVRIAGLADHLCGRGRPGHFEGVATVVLKLLQIAQPARAYFGEKDAQQTAIIRRVVRDFNVPVAIVEAPIVREPDGLAVSSRNVHLSPEERGVAVSLYRILCEAQRLIAAGGDRPRRGARAGGRAPAGRRGAAAGVPGDRRSRGHAAGRAHQRPGAGRRRAVGRPHAAHRQPAVRAARLTRRRLRGKWCNFLPPPGFLLQ